MCYSLYSKRLGHRPQGTMMGIFTSVGSMARAFGPITVGFIYKNWGPRILMIFMLIFVLSSILSLSFNYRRLQVDVEKDNYRDEESNIDRNGCDISNSNVDTVQ